MKYNARKMVRRALLEGKLLKGECQVCQSKEVEAHHNNYHFPLKVTWLCRKHHIDHHKKFGIQVIEFDLKRICEVRYWNYETVAKKLGIS
jgi:hypothetical protein